MAGNRKGGEKARVTNIKRYGEDYYKSIGSKGGKSNGRKHRAGGAKPKGFAADPERAVEYGRRGGQISRRGKAQKSTSEHEVI